MTILSSTLRILQKAGKPLHVKEITKRLIDGGFWETSGKTPVQTVNSRITTDIKRNGNKSPFERTGPGIYTLRDASQQREAPEQNLQFLEKKAVGEPATDRVGYTPSICAQKVLEKYADKKSMHYEDITRKAIEEKWLVTEGKTPQCSMNARIFASIRRQEQRGEEPRFVAHGGGYFGLNEWRDPDLRRQIQQHNAQVRKDLRKQLLKMTPGNFEYLIHDLFDAMDFEMGSRPKGKSDGGIDVRGTLKVDGVVSIEMAIQVKKWDITKRVHASVVQNVRGSLDAHERGMLITTSDFSSGAKTEASQPNKTPIALVNGEELVLLLVKHGFGTVTCATDFLERDKNSPMWNRLE